MNMGNIHGCICVVYMSCVVTEWINKTDAFWVKWVCPLRAEATLTNSNIHFTCQPPVRYQGHLRVWTKPWVAFSLQSIINHWVWISVLLKGVGVWLSMLNQVWTFDWLKNLGSTHWVRHWARTVSNPALVSVNGSLSDLLRLWKCHCGKHSPSRRGRSLRWSWGLSFN